jgi:hypothetical protein
MTPWMELEQRFERDEREVTAQIERAEVLRAHVLQQRVLARSLAMGSESLLCEARSAAAYLGRPGGNAPAGPHEPALSPSQRAQRRHEEEQRRRHLQTSELQEKLVSIGLGLVELSRGRRGQARGAVR